MPLTWGFSGCGHRTDGVRGARPGSRSRAGHVAVVRQPYHERRFVSCAAEITTVISVAPVWRARLALAGP
jgi:hypothetical protein